jgi:hypothetical protein
MLISFFLFESFKEDNLKASGVTAKPARWGHPKTGHWKEPGTLDLVPDHWRFNQV